MGGGAGPTSNGPASPVSRTRVTSPRCETSGRRKGEFSGRRHRTRGAEQPLVRTASPELCDEFLRSPIPNGAGLLVTRARELTRRVPPGTTRTQEAAYRDALNLSPECEHGEPH